MPIFFITTVLKMESLAIVVDKAQLDALKQEISANEGVSFVVDLENQQITTPAGNGFYI